MRFFAAAPRVLRARVSYANVMSTVAVFLALGGGAYALSVPRHSVGRAQLKRNAVTGAKVKNRSLGARDFKRGLLPEVSGARAADVSPAAAPGAVIKSANLQVSSTGRAWILATVRDSFLSCGDAPCSALWGVYVDSKPVPSTGMQLHADAGASDGFTFYTLYGVTDRLTRGQHTVVLARTDSGSPSSVGQLGAQLGALTTGS
jgi:hypothetical protein